jgi:YVTN family beta-propeller protein
MTNLASPAAAANSSNPGATTSPYSQAHTPINPAGSAALSTPANLSTTNQAGPPSSSFGGPTVFSGVKSVALGGATTWSPPSANASGSLGSTGLVSPMGMSPTGSEPRFATYDPTNGYVYVANYNSGTVSAVNGATSNVTTITVGPQPFEMTYDPRNGDVYVPNSGGSTVSVINSTTNKVTTLGVCGAPHSTTHDPANGYVYVPCWGGDLSVIKALTNSSITTITIGSNPRNAAYDTANSLLYVTNSPAGNVTGYVTVVNTTTFSITKNITVGKYPNSTVYDPFHGYVYVTNPNSSSVSIIQGSSDSLIKTVTTGALPEGITYDPMNHRVYVADLGYPTNPPKHSAITIINGTNLEANISEESRPLAGTYDSANGWIYFANFAGSNVSVIKPTSANDTLYESIAAGSEPFSATYDSGNGGVYVPNEGSANLTIVPTAAVTNVSAPGVGSSPRLPTVDAWNGYVYVPNYNNSTVSVISGATSTVVTPPLTLPSGSKPWSAVFNPINGRVYIADSGTGQVSIINGTKVVTNVSVGSTPRFALFNPAGANVYVFNSGATSISVISSTNQVTTISGVGSEPMAGVYDPGNGYIYVTDSGSTKVTPINGATGTKLTNITVGSGPWYPAYDPGNGYVYVPNSESATVSVVSGTTVLASPAAAGGDYFATYDPSNGLVYVPGTAGGVSVFSGDANIATPPAGTEPIAATVNPANGEVFVNNEGGSNVTILNGSLSIGTINVGKNPRWSVYDPMSSDVYVPGFNSTRVVAVGTEGPIVQVSSISIQANATNITLSWKMSPTTATPSIRFGNGTSQLTFPSPNTTETIDVSPSGVATAFIDYLQPSTHYNFLVSDADSAQGLDTSTWEGVWNTGVDSVTTITGVVESANLTHTNQPAGMYVSATCLRFPDAFGYQSWYSYALTNQSDAYSIKAYQYVVLGYGFDSNPCSNSAYVVSLVNSGNYNGSGSSAWSGWWNETEVVWAPQVVSFELPWNLISSYVPVITDFSNANTTNGLAGYSSISYISGTTYNTTETDCSTQWPLSIPLFSICHNTSTDFGSGHTYTSQNGNDFVSQKYWESGLSIFDALNRTVWLAGVSYYATYGNPQFPALQPITDWLTPSTYAANGGYLLSGWGTSGQGIPVYYQSPQGGWVTTSTTKATTGVLSLSVSIDASFFVGFGIEIAHFSWSQTSSETIQNTLSWTVQVPVNTTVPTCFVVYGEGGSATAGTADIIGIWAYTPSGSSGSYSCPLPT